MLLLLPQRYIFSSKSQPTLEELHAKCCCCCYHKGTYFQANHNQNWQSTDCFKLLLLPQRYIFSSKSQHVIGQFKGGISCCCYHKGTYFQANHNFPLWIPLLSAVVVATTKVHIFKQITTRMCAYHTF